MLVLVVEDDHDLAVEVSDGLRRRGHEVIVASNGREACIAASTHDPDAALVDVRLPDINGITLAGLLRGYFADRSRPLRVVGFSSPEMGLEAAGRRNLFDTWVAKPAGIDAIERALSPDGPRGDVTDLRM